MAELRNKVQNALDETRILVLGGQVLLGMQFRAAFEERFGELAPGLRYTCLAGLLLMVVSLVLLMTVATYHQLVERVADSPRILHFVARVMRPAVVPLLLALGLDALVAGNVIAGAATGTVLATALVAAAGGYLVMMEREGERHPAAPEREGGPTPLDARIRHVLTEARVVLPGAQALLGFQFVTILTRRFAELPAGAQRVHLAALLCVAASTLLLLAPAAYHRIVLHGEETESFQRYASRMVLLALVPLGLGIGADVYVVTRLVTGSEALAVAFGAGTVAASFGLWFGLTLVLRHRREARTA